MPTLLQNLATGSNFSIDAYVSEDYTHYIQISMPSNGRILQTFPFDPTDRTVAGAISPETLQALGEHAQEFLAKFAEVMPRQMGAKQFFLIPSEEKLEGYAQPEVSGFPRLRHCDLASLVKESKDRLESEEYKELTAALDKDYAFLVGEHAFLDGQEEMNGDTELELYAQINDILEKADFTPSKQQEYKEEEMQGKMSRFKSAFVEPILMMHKTTRQIGGMVRALRMGSEFVYLSDEVMNQQLIVLGEKVPGRTEHEKEKNRETFLLAYLMNRACTLSLKGQKHLFIIAAAKREKIYEDAGFKNFPLDLDGWRCVLKLGAPGPVIEMTQKRLKALSLKGHKSAATQEDKASAPVAASVAVAAPASAPASVLAPTPAKSAPSKALKYGALGIAGLIGFGLALYLSKERRSPAAASATPAPKLPLPQPVSSR